MQREIVPREESAEWTSTPNLARGGVSVADQNAIAHLQASLNHSGAASAGWHGCRQ